MEHISEDALERYAMRTLPEPELAVLEEHLLICAECRQRLQATEQYVAAMREAAARMTASGTDQQGSEEPSDRPLLGGDS